MAAIEDMRDGTIDALLKEDQHFPNRECRYTKIFPPNLYQRILRGDFPVYSEAFVDLFQDAIDAHRDPA